jgi:hypothetical protein
MTSPFLLIYAWSRPGAIALMVLGIVIFSVSPSGRLGRIKSKMRLNAQNVFRIRNGESPKDSDHWRDVCLLLAGAFLLFSFISTIAIMNFDAEYPNTLKYMGDPEFRKRQDEVGDMIAYPLLLNLIIPIFLVPSSIGYLINRGRASAELGKYAVEIGTAQMLDVGGSGLMVPGEIDLAATAEKMNFPEKDIAFLRAPKKDRTTMWAWIFGLGFFLIFVTLMLSGGS